MDIFTKYDPLIKKLASDCLTRCADGHTQFEDLYQEGRIVLFKLMKKRFKKNKAKFSTLLTSCLINRYAKIVRDSYRKKRANILFMDPNDIIAEADIDVFDIVRNKEIIEKISKINMAFASLFIDGVPEELLIRARNKSRQIAFARRQKSNKITFDRKLIEKYYGISIKKIIEAVEKI